MEEMAVLPYCHLDESLRAMAGQAEGFGRHAIGGLHGAVYRVTSLEDDGCGSLREGCRREEPLWIVFEVSGTIHLSSHLRVSSYKTIDGRGQKIKLKGKGLQLRECEHVIICNLEFEGGTGHDVDAIQIKPKSRHIWIDRCSLREFSDGLIDISRESTDITVSRYLKYFNGVDLVFECRRVEFERKGSGLKSFWNGTNKGRCHLSMHDKAMLIGADCNDCNDRCIRVTIHHCFFDGTRQRHPRVRFGKVHLYNNYTRNWGIYAVCASVESQIISQCNIYEAGQKKVVFKYLTEKAADRDQGACGSIRSEGDLFLNGAQPCIEGASGECIFKAQDHYPTWTMQPASPSLQEVLKVCTGWQAVARPLDNFGAAEGTAAT